MHRRLAVPSEPGLRDWEPSLPDRGVHSVSECRHLSILPAGKDNGRSLQSLSHTGCLRQLGDWLRQNYRFILWDTPSLIRYAEGRFLLRYVDGVVVVVEADKTARDLLVQLRELLAGQSELLGVIINRTDRYSLFGRGALHSRARGGSPE